MTDIMRNARFWRERAEETRTKADSFRIANADKERLLRIAAEYDQLAERAEQWRAASEPQGSLGRRPFPTSSPELSRLDHPASGGLPQNKRPQPKDEG